MMIREHSFSDDCVGMDPDYVRTLYDGQQNDVLEELIEELVSVKVDLSSPYFIVHHPTHSSTSF